MENKAVILNKFEIIEKCINRVNEEYEGEVFYKAEHKEDKASRSADICQVKGRCNRSLAEDWNYGRT